MTLRCVAGLLLLVSTAHAQIPAGHPYDGKIHPNPIVTFVQTSDFESVSYSEARSAAGIELLGLSASEGMREDIALAPHQLLELDVLGRRTEVRTFPVIRQTFRLTDGRRLVLYSFRSPRTDLPLDEATAALNADALNRPDQSGTGRFGEIAAPEMLSVRGRAALFFENSEGNPHTLFWQEGATSHVADSEIAPDILFRVVEDLL